ncbi:hypothetical protein JCM6882_007334 [Rhodosporidiobolus microsporus]
MSVLHILSWLAGILGFVFVLLSLASGLLYVAEVIEEHSGLAKTVGQRLIYAEVVLYILLYFFDDLPLHLVALGIFAHLVYLTNFSRNWPIISLTSLSFVLSCLSVLASHFLSFQHFSARSAAAAHHSSRSRYTHYNAYNRAGAGGGGGREPTFLDIATFFAVCVWLVPFYLFLSLSANDNVLPSSGETPTPSRRASADPSSGKAPHNPPTTHVAVVSPSASPALSSAPSSPSMSRHTRQRSSMMKSALSSAFSIVPSSLRPSTLSSQLPLLQQHQPHGGGAGARNDLPRSPSPSFGFRPYEGQPAFTSALSSSTGGGGLAINTTTSPTKPSPLSWSTSSGPPLSPTTTTSGATGLGFSISSSNGEYGSGGALGSPSLSTSTGTPRTLNFSPNPSRTKTTTFGPPSPAAAGFPLPPSPYAASTFAAAAAGMPGGAPAAAGAGGGGAGLTAPGMARRHTTEHQPPVMPGMPGRRASEAQGMGMGGGGMGAGMGGLLKRRGTEGGGGTGTRKGV